MSDKPNIGYSYDDETMLTIDGGNMLRLPGDNHDYYYSHDEHLFMLPNKGPVDEFPLGGQGFKFIHLDLDGKYVSGITDEQLTQILIHRMKYFQTTLPCSENEVALHGFERALAAMNTRTRRRREQHVEGTMASHESPK